MRLVAILPLLCSVVAVVLSFLCVFAGSRPGFMEGYELFTMNTSRIGYNLLNTDAATDTSSDPLGALIQNITDTITDGINDLLLNPLASSVAKSLGFQDFYSAHMIDYCTGYYTPGPVPNASLPASDIQRNVTACSNHTSMFTFDPRAALEESIANSGLGLDPNATLAKLAFPDAIEEQVRELHVAWKVMFVLYCVGIALSFLCLFASAAGVALGGSDKARALPAVNVLLFVLASLVFLVASALASLIAYKGRDQINLQGGGIGVSASAGNKFVAMTWGLTVVVFIGTLVWCGGCIVPMVRNRKRQLHKIG